MLARLCFRAFTKQRLSKYYDLWLIRAKKEKRIVFYSDIFLRNMGEIDLFLSFCFRTRKKTIIVLGDLIRNEVDSGVDLGEAEVVEVASGEGAMRVAVVLEADAAVLEEIVAVLEENVAVLEAIATVLEVIATVLEAIATVIRVVGATVAIRMALATGGADVGTMVTIRMVVAAVLEGVAAVLEAAAAAVVLKAVSKVGSLGVETINRGNRGVMAEMAIGEVLKATKAVSIRRNPLISIRLLKIKKSLLMIKNK